MIDVQSPASGRIGYLETIRGLAAVQVLLLHCLAAFLPNFVYAPPASGTIGSYIQITPLYFLYDGYSAVYIFFTLSGFVLSHSFSRRLDRPFAAALARALRLGVPALSAVAISAVTLVVFGRPNAEVGALIHSKWFAIQWNPELSIISMLRDGIVNALFLGYSSLSKVPMLTPWQQPGEQSFLVPLWSLSTEFYGSLLVFALCLCERKSRTLWQVAMLIGLLYFIRSAYVCFFIGHAAAVLLRDGKLPSPAKISAFAAICVGMVLCILADLWQPDWLRDLCDDPTSWSFPGQRSGLQQKVAGAILVLIGVVSLPGARRALENRKLVAWSRLSFPLYLVHWPMLFGPAAAFYLFAYGTVGSLIAAVLAITLAVTLSFTASALFLPIDRFALGLSRRVSNGSAGSDLSRSLIPLDPNGIAAN